MPPLSELDLKKKGFLAEKVVEGNMRPMGYEQLTSLAAASALTVPAGARCALLQAEAQDVRWRDDGTSPTATVGMALGAGDPPILYTGDLEAIEFIEASLGGKLNVTYYA